LDELIEARIQARIHTVNFDRIIEKFSGMFDGFGEQFKGLDIEKTLKDFEDLPKALGGLKGFGGGGIENIIKSMIDKDGKIKPEVPQ
jgi:hypothetical protein